VREAVAALFEQSFARPPSVIVRAPGRINLIGDHTDYNDGFVLPMALNRAVWMAASRRIDRTVRVISSERGEGRFELDDLSRQETFVDYLSGVAWAMDPDGLPGLDIAITSDLPAGAGLSSSAAIEIATLLAFSELGDRGWDPVGSAKTARRAENEWVGVASGIMDQLIVAIARAGHATLIDCRSLQTQALPVPREVEVVVLDSGTRRNLTGSGYNERRLACDRAAAVLGVEKLRDAGLTMLDDARLDLVDLRRARHVVTENDRVLAFASALERNDLAAAGSLMNLSHESLRADFSVSTAALDALVESARSQPGCFGARLTGAGMGGCAVALVGSEAIPDFVDCVRTAYRTATGLKAQLYPSEATNGAEVVSRSAPS
jgi:galactokinase